MVLMVARPHRDTKSGVYYLRERVPADLLASARGTFVTLPVGQTFTRARVGDVVKVSLRTKDNGDAKRLFAVAHAALEMHWEALRQGPRKLNHKEAVALAGEVYRAFTASIEHDPRGPEIWAKVLRDNEAARQGNTGPAALVIGSDERVARAMELRFGPITDAMLSTKGLHVDSESRLRVLAQVARALDEVAGQLRRNAEGDYSPDDNLQRYPSWASADQITVKKASISFDALFEKWLKRKERRKPATVRRWRPIICARLPEFLGHSDARQLTKAQVIGWRDHLLGQGISARTVRTVYIAALSSVYTGWVDDDLLPVNPAKGVRVEVQRKPRERERGFTDEEALSILEAAKHVAVGKRKKKAHAALRWVPWLCAFTGARVNEMTQLRKKDVFQEKGIWVVLITPEAGTVKPDLPRKVPLHDQLIEDGFLDLVVNAGVGPLFYDHDPKRNPTASKSPAANVGRNVAGWVREDVGITDKRVQPNHGWRHRFVTIAREVGMDSEKREYILGHALPGMSEEYGDMRGLHREILKLPKVKA
ncbi:MAG: tyrosine-type recombinase/integrase [Parvibaculum sp.]|uniref:DUF6538 domain-containing protein n=1 Tax=Parvibaculum sp. TaxID=2024848 RepID=UPI00284B0923|nr:DUF6538 domain-containing protein [Parvibaculum sp.]MDR3498111.1 tyrosine-type recombinase/integrase [Parvibaculum sp.]